VEAESSLQEALQDVMQLQGPAQRKGVQCTRRLVGKLALRDHRDAHSMYFLACMEVRGAL
jgi:hypothetical protein